MAVNVRITNMSYTLTNRIIGVGHFEMTQVIHLSLGPKKKSWGKRWGKRIIQEM